MIIVSAKNSRSTSSQRDAIRYQLVNVTLFGTYIDYHHATLKNVMIKNVIYFSVFIEVMFRRTAKIGGTKILFDFKNNIHRNVLCSTYLFIFCVALTLFFQH